jgi:GDP-4-dehydro-6-deoxy-D-mannose reductase
MRVLVTGATGFVGRWLMAELEEAGHEAIAAPRMEQLDLGASPDLRPLIRRVDPDTVAHLAAVSFVPEATVDPDRARRVNVEGTRALIQGLDAARSDAALLVTSTAEVYGVPDRLPLTEDAPLRPLNVYAETKVEQERIALQAAGRGRSVVITRAFNHIGPGQRPRFVVPALARRVLELKAARVDAIPVGNVDVRRDFTDVRDVVVAYRRLLEVFGDPRTDRGAAVYNVGSGRSISILDLLVRLCKLAGVEPRWRVDAAQVRAVDIPDSYADSTRLRAITGWGPRIPLDRSLLDVLDAIAAAAI